MNLSDFWSPDFPQKTWDFLTLILRALGISLLISIPLGILLTRFRRLAGPVIYVLALIQTIPSLALLGFLISLLHLLGAGAAVTAAVVYSIFPIVLNTYTGITEVDPKIRDAARGMGMTGAQILWRVELALAMPVIMAGINTGAIYAIGVIAICAMAGAGGLGQYIVTGVTMGNAPLILLGVVPILIITLLFIWGLNSLGRFSQKHGTAGLSWCTVLVLLIAGFSIGEPLIRMALQTSRSGEELRIDDTSQAVAATAVPSVGQRITQAAPRIWEQTVRFLSLTVRGLGVALLLGIPLGIFLTRMPRASSSLISALALLQTIPSLALLGFCISVPLLFQDIINKGLGIDANLSFLIPFGASAVVFATVVYCLFPIVLNTYTGISQVDPRVRDAAKGMGMTWGQILWKVELPLALPVIMAGVRTAAVYSVALVTVGGVLGGARGLGEFVIGGIERNDNLLVLMGTIPIFVISLVVFWLLSGVTWLRRINVSFSQKVAAGLIVVMAVYALADPFFRRRPNIRIGSKNFTENLILGYLMTLLLEEEFPELTVEYVPNLGSNYAFKSLRAGHLDMYPEYTGTVLMYKDALHEKPADAIKKNKQMQLADPDADRGDIITAYVRHEMKKRFNLEVLETFGLNNTYAVLVKETVAKRNVLAKTGDLKNMSHFRVIVDQEFMKRPDGWKGLVATYGLEFDTAPRQLNANLLYRPMLARKAEAVIGFATHWQINAYKLAVLRDDKNYFPSYHAAPLVRQELLRKHPKVAEVLNRLKGQIDDATSRELSRRVVIEKRWAEDVARDFLIEKGLIRPK